jgi:hypothetical protein
VPPYFVDEGFELGDHGDEFGEVGRERVLGADRLPDPVWSDGTLGEMTYWPLGFRWSEASFARNLL